MPGKLVHFELPVQDTQRAKSFWSGVFGWEFGDSAMPDFEYYMVRTGEDQGGAIMRSDKPADSPIVYYDTDDIDTHVARINDLGGRAEGKQPIPGVGWFARAWDTEGNPFSLFQSDESVAPG